MATERSTHGQWREEQIAALVELGVNIMDATKRVDSILAKLPIGADPSVWIPGVDDLDQEIDKEVINDAAVEWIASDSTPPKYKRLLHSVEEDK